MGKIYGIRNCSRCGGEHPELEAHDFTRPVEINGIPPFTRWATCPTNGEPLLLGTSVVSEETVERLVFGSAEDAEEVRPLVDEIVLRRDIELTDEERHIIKGALGIRQGKPSYRNKYHAPRSHPICSALCERGLMEWKLLFSGDGMWVVTERGKAAVGVK